MWLAVTLGPWARSGGYSKIYGGLNKDFHVITKFSGFDIKSASRISGEEGKMKLYKVRAVILKAKNIQEADQLLTLFSRERGKIRVVAYGACKPTSRKRGAVQPFSYSHFLLCRGNTLDSVSQCELLEMFPELRGRLDKLGYALYLMELVDSMTFEGESSEALFRLILGTLRLLGQGDHQLVARAFEIKLLTILGYRPCLENCVVCGGPLTGGKVIFHAAAGGVLCDACAHRQPGGLPCNRGTVELLKLLLRWDPARLGQLRLDASARIELRQILHRHMEYHLERQMKSTRFLKLIEHSGNA